MNRLPAAAPLPPAQPRADHARRALARTLAALALSVAAAPLAAQEQPSQPQPGTFSLPPSTPTPAPAPAPAGPADERAGVAIPPRTASPAPASPAPAPAAAAAPAAPTPRESAPSPAPATTPQRQSAPAPAATGAVLPQANAPAGPAGSAGALPVLPDAGAPLGPTPDQVTAPGPGAGAPTSALGASILPAWWPLAAGGAGALVVLGLAGAIWQRRRKRRPLRLAAPAAQGSAPADRQAAAAEPDSPRLDLTLEITSATRSVMMFTLQYRLTIANRSDRAVNDLAAAVQLACARAAGDGNAPSAGAAQGLAAIDRIGPHQARSLTGTVQLPLNAITPLRQGATPLFVPLAHVTLEGEGLRATTRSFVIGPRSPSGRVHPITLDQPPGSITGLVAQLIALPAQSAAA